VADEDAESIPDGTVLQTDVAIIGAGAAGITIARRLAGSRLKVLLIESGGDEAEDRFHTLARGEIVGTPYWPIDANRHRCIGGTTKVWAGWCRPLDNLDFAKREWVPWSGWPIARASLIPYYREAHEICQLGPFDYDVAAWERELKTHRLPLDERTVATKMFQLSPPTRFGSTYLPVLRRAGNVSLVYHATVLEIETTPEGKVVRALRLGTLGGSRFRVEARSFVLATGGLENARLLLLSDRYRSAGLGNDNDHVGRYFMEHLHFTFGVGVLRWPRRQFERLYSPARRRAVGRIFVAPELQREQELLNGNVMLYPASRTGTAWWGQAVRRPIDRLQGGVMVRLAHTIEQPPNPASRLTLGAERDAFGLRRICLDWRVGRAEQRTFQRNWRAFGHSIESAGLGKVNPAPGEDAEAWPPAELQGQRGHHIGTTRMSTNPRDGVVNEDCRVHGIANLYVAGSSVFPTAGAGTPTLTIVALAIRLADHLRRER
jgi:choline dehydrogenase-like flavoprotein